MEWMAAAASPRSSGTAPPDPGSRRPAISATARSRVAVCAGVGAAPSMRSRSRRRSRRRDAGWSAELGSRTSTAAWAAVQPQEFAGNEDGGHQVRAVGHLGPLDHLEEEGGAGTGDLLEALMDCGEGGLGDRPRRHVVEADDRLVSGQDEPRGAERPHDPDGVVVGGRHHRRRGHPSLQHAPGRVLAPALEVVDGLEDEALLGLDAVGRERLLVGGEALGDVGLDQAAGEGDAPVPVAHQVGHRLGDPGPVVGTDHGAGEALDLVAHHHHRLAGVAEGLEVPGLDGVEHHQEAADLLPGRAEGEARHQRLGARGPAQVADVAGLPGGRPAEPLLGPAEVQVQGLDGDHPGPRGPGRGGDPGDQVAGVAARHQRGENSDLGVVAQLRLNCHGHASHTTRTSVRGHVPPGSRRCETAIISLVPARDLAQRACPERRWAAAAPLSAHPGSRGRVDGAVQSGLLRRMRRSAREWAPPVRGPGRRPARPRSAVPAA